MPFNLALSGLNAASSDLNVTANNIANSNTSGFKSSRAEFADVFSASGGTTAIGNGVRLARVAQQFDQGNINATNNSLDLAISGKGFFTVRGDSGLAYTRAGAFHRNNEGYVVNSEGQKLQAYPASGDGSFDSSSLTDLKLDTSKNAPAATTSAQLGLNLAADAAPPANATFDPSDPTSFNDTTSFTVYDSLGATHKASLYLNKESAPNTWASRLYLDGSAVGGAQTLAFDASGSLVGPGVLSFPAQNPGTGAAALNLKLDLSNVTQFGNSYSVNNITQNGYASGNITGVDIGSDGVASARYSNGQSQALGKLVLANFSNPQGLQQIGDTSWGETFQSGQAVHGEAGNGSLGSIQSGALEGSNVDLTGQLVNMIKAQRNFQANAQTISTANQVTQTIMNIRS